MSDNRFKIEKKDFYTLITIENDKLDAIIAPVLKSELVLIAGNGEKNIVIEMENVKYCDSSGLSTILVANRLSKNARGTFVLSNLQTAVMRLISISQLDTVLNIADNIEEAQKIILRNFESSDNE
ncbi:MAG: STAS domain-containing protein [Bacteroidales bacterium]|nr:STAS domain-containing protein [Bacteroidales bacterium]